MVKNQLEKTADEARFLSSMMDLSQYKFGEKETSYAQKDQYHCDPCDACGPDSCAPDDINFLNK